MKKRPLIFISGASSGIGAASAKALANAGYDLVLVARRLERLQRLKSEIEKAHATSQVHVFALDLLDLAQCHDFFEKQKSLLIQVDVVINNAGLALGVDKLQDARGSDLETMMDLNVKTLLRVTKEFLPTLIEKKSGHIVNIGSVAGRWVYPGGAVYCASKFAVRAISEGLRMDLHGTGVRVTNLEPGMVETEFSNVRLGDDHKAKKVYEGMTPLRAEDIAETIVWVLSRPAHVNIQEMVIFPTDQSSVSLVHRK